MIDKNYANTWSRQWALHKYGTTKTWGRKTAQRKKFFLKQMNVHSKHLHGKSLLDAGCGNGELTMALTEYGLDVIGMDMSKSIYRANYMVDKLKINVKFMRGDVANPPFRSESFDYIYAEGVLHHTPNTKDSFTGLSKLLKPNGKFFVWLYLRFELTGYNVLKCKFYEKINKIISRLPATLQDFFCYSALIPFVIKNMGAKNLREKLISFYDGFTPKYNHRHAPEEIISWFKEAGFKNIKITDRSEKGGIGIVGVKK